MAKVLKAKLQEIAMDLIDEPGGMVRMDIDGEELQELADNIAEVGLLQPIMVRPKGDRFEVVAGHRRLLAYRLLGRNKIPSVVRNLDDVQCALARASENLRRVDISPIEEAAVYSDLRDNHGLTIPEIGKRMGKTGGVVKRRLDLLRMPSQLQQAIHKKQISYGVGEELWSIGDLSGIDYYLGFCIEHGATVAVARVWAKEWKDSKRREGTDIGGGRGVTSPMESRPNYVACDLCKGPMELGTEETFRSCAECTKLILSALKGGG